MCSAMNAKRDRAEQYRTYIETLLESFYKLKQTTRDHVDDVYNLTMVRQAPSPRDSYMGILRALEFLRVGTSATDRESLLIAFVYERNKPIFDFVQDFNRSKLECQATRSIWGFHELKVITAKWMQGKDEDQFVRLGRSAMSLFDRDIGTTPRYLPAKDRQFGSKAYLKGVWDRFEAESPYSRLVSSLRLLGLMQEGGEPDLRRWLRGKTGLKAGQLLDHSWDLTHLELVVAKCVREGVLRSPGMHGATDTHGGGYTRNRETLKHVGTDVEDEDDEEMKEVEEVVRADFPAQPGDPATFRLFQAVSKARETAKEANKEVVKAYETVAWTSAALMAHMAKGKDHTDGSVGSGRHIEGPRQTKYPWRST